VLVQTIDLKRQFREQRIEHIQKNIANNIEFIKGKPKKNEKDIQLIIKEKNHAKTRAIKSEAPQTGLQEVSPQRLESISDALSLKNFKLSLPIDKITKKATPESRKFTFDELSPLKLKESNNSPPLSPIKGQVKQDFIPLMKMSSKITDGDSFYLDSEGSERRRAQSIKDPKLFITYNNQEKLKSEEPEDGKSHISILNHLKLKNNVLNVKPLPSQEPGSTMRASSVSHDVRTQNSTTRNLSSLRQITAERYNTMGVFRPRIGSTEIVDDLEGISKNLKKILKGRGKYVLEGPNSVAYMMRQQARSFMISREKAPNTSLVASPELSRDQSPNRPITANNTNILQELDITPEKNQTAAPKVYKTPIRPTTASPYAGSPTQGNRGMRSKLFDYNVAVLGRQNRKMILDNKSQQVAKFSQKEKEKEIARKEKEKELQAAKRSIITTARLSIK